MKFFAGTLLGFILGFAIAVSIQNLLRAGEASKNKRSLAEASNLSIALEKFHEANGKYPPLDRGIAELPRYLEPKFISHVQTTDSYSQPYLVFTDETGVVVASTGRNGFVVRRGPLRGRAAEALGALRLHALIR